ncbi:hypothetical protein E1A91_D10G145400v1 [Gossypium mustelinum]|uniref:Uncharacterized protein n=1 Tax=Gossypium mustelinum TaxID=34275 RepID=A0A5D2T9B3_GOSMU|nr:hypothetical protein E1A91_D10G145400v1 [Gossypium mustelinum]
MQLLRVITITLPHPRFPNPCFPLLCFSIFCPCPQPSDSPTPPYTDTFFIAILPDFAFTRLLFIELFPNFPGYRSLQWKMLLVLFFQFRNCLVVASD